ncbi:MAG: hypothetical protein KKA81_08610 [Bacteroidetes bacterium]|nr:hypothetical protein [Bacteroidota bacterium]
MERLFGDGSYLPSFNISGSISIDKAIEIVNNEAGNIKLESGVVDALISGLDSSAYNSDCFNALVDVYTNNPGSNIQYDIISKLTLSDCPNAQNLMKEILSDNTIDSLSEDLNDVVKADVLSLMNLDVDDRAGEILKQILETDPDFPTDAHIDYKILKGDALRISYERITDPNEHNTEPDPDILLKHFKDLMSNSDMTEVMVTLAEQMNENSDFGRTVGQLMKQNVDLNEQVTKVILQVSEENPGNKEILKNTLSYCRNVGLDIATTYMSEDQKLSFIPRLYGETISDRFFLNQDALLTRLDAGESISLNTFSNEGLVAIPILLNIKLNH